MAGTKTKKRQRGSGQDLGQQPGQRVGAAGGSDAGLVAVLQAIQADQKKLHERIDALIGLSRSDQGAFAQPPPEPPPPNPQPPALNPVEEIRPVSPKMVLTDGPPLLDDQAAWLEKVLARLDERSRLQFLKATAPERPKMVICGLCGFRFETRKPWKDGDEVLCAECEKPGKVAQCNKCFRDCKVPYGQTHPADFVMPQTVVCKKCKTCPGCGDHTGEFYCYQCAISGRYRICGSCTRKAMTGNELCRPCKEAKDLADGIIVKEESGAVEAAAPFAEAVPQMLTNRPATRDGGAGLERAIVASTTPYVTQMAGAR